jgi:23S rRNA pseudouridine1911/1915/1917 synthase
VTAGPAEGSVETVPAALDGERVDRVVAASTGLARAAVSSLIAGGAITVDGAVITKGSTRVRVGQRIGVRGRVEPEVPPVPLADPTLGVRVLHADAHLIVVDKPAGLVVHPGHGHRHGTLVHGLLSRFPDLEALAVGDARERPGIVHRLDRGTSGVLMIARTEAARVSLSEQLAGRRAGRDYLAVVEGLVAADRGEIVAPLARDRSDPTRMAVDPAGRHARTRLVVLGRSDTPEPASALRCALDTGRTHQIRVHLASIGHVVVGDATYGSTRSAPPSGLARPALHAYELHVEHPATGESMSFRAPVPADLAGLAAAAGLMLADGSSEDGDR